MRNWEFLAGRATAIVSEAGLASGGCLTCNFNFLLLGGGWLAGSVVDCTAGGTGADGAEAELAAAWLEILLDMPRSVASLYFLILALEIREVK